MRKQRGLAIYIYIYIYIDNRFDYEIIMNLHYVQTMGGTCHKSQG